MSTFDTTTCAVSPRPLRQETAVLSSPKIRPRDLERSAIVYVRQSSPQQVANNRESTERQYALVERAVGLGWPRDRIEVIDEDQAITAQTAEGRLGFQRMLAEVGLDHVGIIFGIEMSRLARCGKDWHQLIELCSIFRTLLADQNGLYDPTDYSDRLVLGLTGIMSEAELHILKGRMYEGLLNKARRGDVFNHLPMGYVKLPSGRPAIDPDEQVQGVVRLVFEQFEKQGSLHGLLRYLVHHGIKIPIRPHFGPNRGNLEWHRPNRPTLQNMLHHPIYAGSYRWGHRQVDPRRKLPGRRGTGRTIHRPDECQVLIPDHCPAYISQERFDAIQERMAANRATAATVGAPRHGPSLLAGLLTCGRCGRRMFVGYSGRRLHYRCARANIDYGEPGCQSLSGEVVDQFVAGHILRALEPASLELSMAAGDDLQQERDRLTENWQQRLERGRYECQRAERQFQAVEPENRLVARELERRWEESLREQRSIEEAYARFRQTMPEQLTDAEREWIRSLAEDVPALWNEPSTTPQDRQRVARSVLERVVVGVQGTSERVDVTLHWAGGFNSQHELIRPVDQYVQLSNYPELIARVAALHGAGLPRATIAAKLNEEGFHPPKRVDAFNAAMVGGLLPRCNPSLVRATGDREMLDEDEWWPRELSVKLQIPIATIHRWIGVGWVHARKLNDIRGRWALWADKDELQRLADLHTTPRTWGNRPRLEHLQVPKNRNERQ